MISASGERVSPNVVNDPCDVADFSQRDSRARLVKLFNEVAGVPSYAMCTLQEEFVLGRMEPAEAVAFVEVCSGLISVALSSSAPSR
jgi:hypothetical protein